MSNKMRRARWRRAAIAGGRPITAERWNQLVDQAAAGMRSTDMYLVSTATMLERRPQRMEVLEPGDVVMRAQDVLGLEMALIEAEQLAEEVRELAGEDLDASRAARLSSVIERARTAVERRVKRRGDA